MRKRDLQDENRRLAAECSYLRGRVEVLEGQGERAVAHVRDILTTFSTPAPLPDPYTTTGENEMATGEVVGEDWTDQLAPRTMTEADMEELYRDWNTAPHIGDPEEGV